MMSSPPTNLSALSKGQLGLGFLIGRSALTNFKFAPDKPYAGCRICGEVFQSDANRLGSWDGIAEWRIRHNKRHQEWEHLQFAASGRKFSPEAQHKLVTLGVIDFMGILVDDEISAACREAPRAPANDVEGS
jgi:hypothetical protein